MTLPTLSRRSNESISPQTAEEEKKRGGHTATRPALLAYLPERKKSKLKSGRVFKYNNARQREGDWKTSGGSAKSVPSVRPSARARSAAATNELQCVIKHPTKTTQRRREREDEMAEATATGGKKKQAEYLARSSRRYGLYICPTDSQAQVAQLQREEVSS